jgi:phenylacetate-CoA ligase
MSDSVLQLYYFLPPSLRTVAATARGFYLRSWRYGPETDQLAQAALEREHWSSTEWRSWRENRLTYVLNRAATRVPYYREHWRQRRLKGDRACHELLENWPILEKEQLRENPRAFIADDCDPSRMFHEHTSGTTGKSLDLWWSRATVRQWYALFEARFRRWYGVSRHDRWAILGGQCVTPVHQRKAPFWVWNKALNQLYCSTYHLAPAFIPEYLRALVRYKVRYLWGYTSALYELAESALELNFHVPGIEAVITNAEPVFDYQRRAIERAFNCKLRETYGLAEIVAAASECNFGNMHLWPEVGLIECLTIADGFNQAANELICTGLLNSDMPLIRYRTGDSGIPADVAELCGCGRSLPLIKAIEGRVDDLLYTSDGRRVGRLDPVFKADLPLREAQVVQETIDQLRVRFVPAPNYTSRDGLTLIKRLQARLGNIHVILEQVDRVPRMSNGKFRAVICNLPPLNRRSQDEVSYSQSILSA